MNKLSVKILVRRSLISLLGSVLFSGCGGGTAVEKPISSLSEKTFSIEKVALRSAPSASGCVTSTWSEGKSYVIGDIVLFNGNYYKASHDNPGYDPTISTYFWDKFASIWAADIDYPVGTLVAYSANGNFYKEVNAATGSVGSGGTDPTISTYLWNLYTCGTSTPTPGSGNIVGIYYPNWTSAPMRIRDLPATYNLIYLFSAYAATNDSSGKVTFTSPGDGLGAATNLNADIAYARSTQGRKIMLSVGGAGHGMSFPNRTVSQTFVDSIESIYTQLGGFDRMDWNTFEASQTPSTSEMQWISLELKRLHPGFIISAPPAPWKSADKAFCQTLVQAGAMDYCAPQYYDGPDLNTPAYVVPNVQEWVTLLGATHVVVGFGIDGATANYMTLDQAKTIWTQVKAANPTIRGGFDWQYATDQAQGWPYANTLAPMINP